MRTRGAVSRGTIFVAVLVLAVAGTAAFWLFQPKSDLVVYVALDQEYAEPILREFERQSGKRVAVKYDTESVKSIGFFNELKGQQDRPQADVFWNNEIVLTIRLKQAGVLAPYRSPSAAAVPAQFKDPEGCWTGFAARARVIIYNKQLLPEEKAPQRVADLLNWGGKATLARPLAGTTFAHAAVLWARDEAAARAFFDGAAAQETGLFVSGGNAQVRENVAAGRQSVGLTDSDDAYGAMDDGQPVGIVWPDQEPGGAGVLLLPNTVALIAGAPHPEAAKQLIDYLLSPEVEAALARSRARQIPLQRGVAAPAGLPALKNLRLMKVDFARAAEAQAAAQKYLGEKF